MKAIDICLPPSKTSYEAYLRMLNNMEAQFIGMSVFSKTIEVTQKPIDAVGQVILDWHPEVESECCNVLGQGGDAIDNPGYCRGCKEHCSFIKTEETN